MPNKRTIIISVTAVACCIFACFFYVLIAGWYQKRTDLAGNQEIKALQEKDAILKRELSALDEDVSLSSTGVNPNFHDIDDLMARLDAIEEELDIIYNRRHDVYKIIEVLKREMQIEKKLLEDPGDMKMLREAGRDKLYFQSDPLLADLNLPYEKQDELMGILVDEDMESLEIGLNEDIWTYI
jgi:hypothetical protein